MTMTSNPVDNGVNTAALLDARNALSQAPEAAEFTWRSTTTWMNGTYSRSTVEGFTGLGQDHVHQATFTIDADHPVVFAGHPRDPGQRRQPVVFGVDVVVPQPRAGDVPHRLRQRGTA